MVGLLAGGALKDFCGSEEINNINCAISQIAAESKYDYIIGALSGLVAGFKVISIGKRVDSSLDDNATVALNIMLAAIDHLGDMAMVAAAASVFNANQGAAGGSPAVRE